MKIFASSTCACLLLATSLSSAFVTPTTGPQRTSTTFLREGPLDILGGIGDTFSKEIGGLFKKEEAPLEEEKVKAKPQLPDVVIEPEYKLGIAFLAGGFLLDLIPYIQLTLGPLVTLLGVLFVVQAARIRFCFDGEAFELRQSGAEMERTGENIVVGGENRWTYDSFVNYDFFPEGWIDQPQGPIGLF